MTRDETLDVPLAKNIVREVSFHGQTYSGALSAFDFPRSIRITLNESLDRATVQFIYVTGAEETVQQLVKTGAAVHIGSKSGRVLRIEFPVPKVPGKVPFTLELLVREPLRQLKRDAGKLSWEERPARRLAHYKMFPDLFSIIEGGIEKLRAGRPGSVATP
jgi:hypothetical protein